MKVVREHLAVTVLAGRVVDDPAFLLSLHTHPEWELTLIHKGAGTQLIGDNISSFVAGDLVLLGPDIPHSWATTPPRDHLQASVVHFGPGVIALINHLAPSAQLRKLLHAARHGLRFSSLPSHLHNTMVRLAAIPDAEPHAIAELFDLLGSLTDLTPTQLATNLDTPIDPQAQYRLDAVCDYVLNEHPAGVTLGAAAKIAHMTPAAFSRFFRRSMGRTFTDYLIDVRLATASTLLRETNTTISTIAAQAGFNNIANFNRQFRRRYHTTPGSYRRTAISVDVGTH